MKKIISTILAAVLTFGACGVPNVYAKDKDEYSQVLLKVKEKINIPDMKKFNYSVDKSENNEFYNFTWEEGTVSISVRADEKGRIYNYTKYDSEVKEEANAKYSTEALQSVAYDFLKQVQPDTYSQMKPTVGGVDSFMGTFFEYVQYYKGIPVVSNEVDIYLEGNEVTSYTAVPSYWDIKLPDPATAIDETKAKEYLFENDGVKLYYSKKNEFDKGFYGVYAINSVVRIDAFTGEAITLYLSPYYKFAASYDNGEEDVAMGEAHLSPSEKNEIERLAGSVTPQAAVDIINKAFSKNYNSKDVSYSYSSYGYANTLTISTDEFYASLTQDGKAILNYSDYSSDVNTDWDAKVDEDKAKEKTDAVIASLCKGDYKYEEDKDYISGPKANNYIKQVNGIPSLSETATVTVDKDMNVVYFSRSYFNNSQYPDLSKAISKEEAYKEALEYTTFTKKYIFQNDNNEFAAKLVWSVDDNVYIDPITKDKLDYNGNVVKPEKKGYADLDGYWCEEAATELLKMGFYFEDEEFQPNKALTQEEIVGFFTVSDYGSYVEDSKKAFIKRFFGDDYKAKSNITKYEFVKKIGDTSPAFKILAQKGEFVKPFEDVSDKYTGYVAILKAFGAVTGNAGKFNGEKPLTRGEFVQILYKILTATDADAETEIF
ncbi:MAG: S-layer homology domain-containing protein [Firmicutes bacterium]|nr:S-layer homology domain-containing protein [Bacillota bacterium]